MAPTFKMPMAPFNESDFEQKLIGLKNTHESISALSNWCQQNPQHCSKIIQIWLNVLKQVKIDHRLLLFYFANDVIQYSKKRRLSFVENWAPALQKATTLVRDDSVKNKILRLFKIWDERAVYDEGFLMDLSGLLTHNKFNRTDLNEFQPQVMFSRILSVDKTEAVTLEKLNAFKKTRIYSSKPPELKKLLKDAEKDQDEQDDLIKEVERGIDVMKDYVQALEREVKERTNLVELMELGELYYEKEARDSKTVLNAYKCFGSKIQNVLGKLQNLIPSLASPPLSPPASPLSPDDSNELPDLLQIHTTQEEGSSDPYVPPPVYTPMMTLTGDFTMNSVKPKVEPEAVTEIGYTNEAFTTNWGELGDTVGNTTPEVDVSELLSLFPSGATGLLQPPPPPPLLEEEPPTVLGQPESPPADTDMRNALDLEEPVVEPMDYPPVDTDFRRLPHNPNLITIDNNESIDMDLSDDEDKRGEGRALRSGGAVINIIPSDEPFSTSQPVTPMQPPPLPPKGFVHSEDEGNFQDQKGYSFEGGMPFTPPPGPPHFDGPRFEGPQRFEGPPRFEVSQRYESQPRFPGAPRFEGPRFAAPQRFSGPPRFDGPQRFEVPQRFDGQRFDGPQRFEGPQRFDGPPRFKEPQRFDGPQRFEAPQRFDDPQRFEAPQRFDGPQRFEAPQRFDGPQRFEAPQRFDGPPRFEAPQRFEGPQRLESPQNFEIPRFEGPQRFELPQRFESPQRFDSPRFETPQRPRFEAPPHPGFESPTFPSAQPFEQTQDFEPQVNFTSDDCPEFMENDFSASEFTGLGAASFMPAGPPNYSQGLPRMAGPRPRLSRPPPWANFGARTPHFAPNAGHRFGRFPPPHQNLRHLGPPMRPPRFH